MTRHRIRVCVVDASPGLAAYPRLDECDVDVVGALPNIADALRAPAQEHDVFVVGSTSAQLHDPRFLSKLRVLARRLPTALVVPSITRHTAMVAATARVAALLVRGTAPAEFTQSLRAASRGEVAYPSEAVARLLRLVPATRA